MHTALPPLAGIKVLDFSELLPGPFLTQNFVELGAVVTKIERPPHGDSARQIAPGLFSSVNRGKHTIMADLKDKQQAASILDLVADADIVVEGFRPGVMKRLGFDYETLSSINPQIIYVSITGYGQTGRLADLPGHDINYLASSGVLALSGSDPVIPSHGAGIPLADLCGAMYALSSTLAALIQRKESGKGQYLDVSLTDCSMHWMNPRIGHFDEAKIESLEHQREDILTKPAYGLFRTADNQLMSIAALEDHFWARLAAALKLDLPLEKYASYSARVTDAACINIEIAKQVAKFQANNLLELLIDADVPASPVVQPSDLRKSDLSLQRQLFTGGDSRSFVRYPVNMVGI
tara:strand:+ start:10826 stop:11875 length:1050 start_codon:yes stop_codon:yes gene_type:complete